MEQTVIKPLVLALPGPSSPMASRLAAELGAELGAMTVRQFPDGETYLRVESDVKGRQVVVVSAMTRPDEQTLALMFLAQTLRELDALSIGWVAPYLPYMRQDSRFHPGEALTSRGYARIIDTHFDWLVTIDPHLHRLDGLEAIYTIPARVVHSAPAIADWIRGGIDAPFLVGPDAESEQWVRAVAELLGAPFVILDKVRRGDRDVTVSAGDGLEAARGHQVIIVDDIISTGRTMIETIERLRQAGITDMVCLAIHGLFVEDALDSLSRAGARRVVSTNSLDHETNAIDVTEALAIGVKQAMSPTMPVIVSDGVA
jgi:ribose-phosphate pyrophosphokinase